MKKEAEAVTLTLTPTATATWTSSNESKATVADGVVTGVAVGQAIITAKVGEASAFVVVTVSAADQGDEGGETPVGDLHPSLQGSEYYLFALDATTYEKISSKVVADYRCNDVNIFIDTWRDGETYSSGTTSGKNFYGEVEGWISLVVVAPENWSGGGIRSTESGGETVNPDNKKLDAIMANPSDYYFHVAMKSTDEGSHHFRLYGTTEVDLIVGVDGQKDFDGNDIDVSFTRDGEWQEIEVPMTVFTNKGLVYNSTAKSNFMVLGWVSGGQVGKNLQFDACFIYKK